MMTTHWLMGINCVETYQSIVIQSFISKEWQSLRQIQHKSRQGHECSNKKNHSQESQEYPICITNIWIRPDQSIRCETRRRGTVTNNQSFHTSEPPDHHCNRVQYNVPVTHPASNLPVSDQRSWKWSCTSSLPKAFHGYIKSWNVYTIHVPHEYDPASNREVFTRKSIYGCLLLYYEQHNDSENILTPSPCE